MTFRDVRWYLLRHSGIFRNTRLRNWLFIAAWAIFQLPGSCPHYRALTGLIDYLRFYVPLKNFSLIWRRHHCRWRAGKVRSMLGAQGLWAGRNPPAVTLGLAFSGLIRRTVPISRLFRHTRGCGWFILTERRRQDSFGLILSTYWFSHVRVLLDATRGLIQMDRYWIVVSPHIVAPSGKYIF
jgi:hypothetical protein